MFKKEKLARRVLLALPDCRVLLVDDDWSVALTKIHALHYFLARFRGVEIDVSSNGLLWACI